jgi:hypothetical protein
MTITDEMVKQAEIAYDRSCQNHKGADVGAMRAALEAVAPLLIADYQQSLNKLGEAYDKKCDEVLKARAQGMREALEIIWGTPIRGEQAFHEIYAAKKAILARAQELDRP